MMEEKKKTRKVILFVICLFAIALIIAIILPAFQKAKDSGPGYARIICMGNLKGLCTAYHIYQDENDIVPIKSNWCDLFQQECDMGDSGFLCPVDIIGPCSYAMNENIPPDANELPPGLVLLFESAPGWNQVGGPDDVVTDRHGRPGANIAFADGHVEFVEADKIPGLRWKTENEK